MPRSWTALLALATACGTPDGSDTYLGESSVHRRAVLERSLWRPDLPYSKKLLDSYALDQRGWDLLPLMAGEESIVTPENDAEWLELGRQTFFDFPMRTDAYIEWIAERPELWAQVGIEARADGPDQNARGMVRFTDSIGRTRTAITCAFCHARGGVAGFADRRADLGLARALYEETSSGTTEPRFRAWGPGRIDVTDDAVDSPTTIPDLWGVKYSNYLNASGVLTQEPGSPDTLAVRFETQYILGHNLERRPDRRRIYALALFVLSLEPEVHQGIETDEAGQRAFSNYCARCHDPNQGYSGPLIDASSLTSDPTVAFTPERGTGFYKVPSLIGVSRGAPYFHDGSALSLRDVLTEGHPNGVSPPASEVELLLAVLERL